MDIKTDHLKSNQLQISITSFEIQHNNDTYTTYFIKIRSSDPQSPQSTIDWHLKRGYEDFESLHLSLLSKFDKTPYLPCKVVLALRPEEREKRKVYLQTYLRFCAKDSDILNSLEFRLFLDIGSFANARKTLGRLYEPPAAACSQVP